MEGQGTAFFNRSRRVEYSSDAQTGEASTLLIGGNGDVSLHFQLWSLLQSLLKNHCAHPFSKLWENFKVLLATDTPQQTFCLTKVS